MHTWKDCQDDLEFLFRHCLHYEAAVVAEEEETSTSASSFSCLEDLVPISARVKRHFDLLPIDTVHQAHTCANSHCVGCDVRPRKLNRRARSPQSLLGCIGSAHLPATAQGVRRANTLLSGTSTISRVQTRT